MSVGADWVAKRAVEICDEKPDQPILLSISQAMAEWDLRLAPTQHYRTGTRKAVQRPKTQDGPLEMGC